MRVVVVAVVLPEVLLVVAVAVTGAVLVLLAAPDQPILVVVVGLEALMVLTGAQAALV
jgi:hypothetical protein